MPEESTNPSPAPLAAGTVTFDDGSGRLPFLLPEPSKPTFVLETPVADAGPPTARDRCVAAANTHNPPADGRTWTAAATVSTGTATLVVLTDGQLGSTCVQDLLQTRLVDPGAYLARVFDDKSGWPYDLPGSPSLDGRFAVAGSLPPAGRRLELSVLPDGPQLEVVVQDGTFAALLPKGATGALSGRPYIAARTYDADGRLLEDVVM
ncbi:hypothetical protein [Pseudonocardia sp. TRM90224]|uniref:hypothetical protein n=1 Tax=Pseudonocardia sp. TRM90224 TaxID=2812678 RepID=UPI001E623F1F|nr:hypothetical protein [Pseudonocardia sp. TRM90224]